MVVGPINVARDCLPWQKMASLQFLPEFIAKFLNHRDFWRRISAQIYAGDARTW